MNDDIRTAVRDKYGAIASGVTSGRLLRRQLRRRDHVQPVRREQTATLPAEAVNASLGCGNPTALIDLLPGQTVST